MKRQNGKLFVVLLGLGVLLQFRSLGAQVIEDWVARYDGPITYDDEDQAEAIALDVGGNIYVTGGSFCSQGNPTGYDYVTIKYDSTGVQQWMAVYDGPLHRDDMASAIAVDNYGNVYVTGSSEADTSESLWDRDIATIKYDTYGNQLWVARYDGPGTPDSSEDYGHCIKVDGNGNVYVGGNSMTSETYFDYVTIKYNSAGIQQWASIYENGEAVSAMDLDLNGNIYVTGSGWQGSSGNFTTIKYNPSGVQQWIALHNIYAEQEATSIAVSENNNVYIAGYARVNQSQYEPDYVTIKYNSTGNEQWVATYDGPDSYYDYANDLALDPNENVVVTGTSYGTNTNADYTTVKYDASGIEQWVARYNGIGTGNDEAYALAVDQFGDIYVTGSSSSSSGYPGNPDYFTIKYSSSGAQQWTMRYDGPPNGYDRALAIALDEPEGYVYVTGWSEDDSAGYDYATIKYIQTSTGVIEEKPGIHPAQFTLHSPSPNPFNPTTVASFELRVPSHVTLRAYDLSGRLVTILVDGWREAGEHRVTWEATELPSGMYLMRLQAGEQVQVQKAVLMK